MNKKLLAAAVATALAVPMTAQAIKFSVSGHVHRAIRFVDTGDVSDIQHTDDVSSRTRVRFRGSEDIGNGMKAGVYIEFGVASTNPDTRDVKTGDGGDRFGADIRHSALWFGGSWGTVWLGHTSSATDGKMTSDYYTGLSDEQEHWFDDVAQVSWRINETDTGIDIRDVFYGADGGRRDIIRYDSPKFGPVQLQVAVGNNEFWDVGAKIAGDFSGVAYKLHVGYSSDGNNDCGRWDNATGIATGATASCEDFGLSGGVKFSQGTAITGAWSTSDVGDTPAGTDFEYDMWMLKLGHAFGNNQVSISYQEHESDGNSTATGSLDAEATTYGIGFEHTIPKVGVTLHANYHRYDVEFNQAARNAIGITSDPDEIDKFMVGARIQFK